MEKYKYKDLEEEYKKYIASNNTPFFVYFPAGSVLMIDADEFCRKYHLQGRQENCKSILFSSQGERFDENLQLALHSLRQGISN